MLAVSGSGVGAAVGAAFTKAAGVAADAPGIAIPRSSAATEAFVLAEVELATVVAPAEGGLINPNANSTKLLSPALRLGLTVGFKFAAGKEETPGIFIGHVLSWENLAGA
jgi:hypothetical protein